MALQPLNKPSKTCSVVFESYHNSKIEVLEHHLIHNVMFIPQKVKTPPNTIPTQFF